jgi:hypothetical protein
MSVPRHLDEAAERLEAASARIERARGAPRSQETLAQWLEAVTDYAEALSDLHRFTNESVHEKLQSLARQLRTEGLRSEDVSEERPAAD